MNLVDSSAWLEHFGNGANANEFAQAIEDVDRLVVPSICVYEGFRRTRQLAGESTALAVAAVMLEGAVADVTAPIAYRGCETLRRSVASHG